MSALLLKRELRPGRSWAQYFAWQRLAGKLSSADSKSISAVGASITGGRASVGLHDAHADSSKRRPKQDELFVGVVVELQAAAIQEQQILIRTMGDLTPPPPAASQSNTETGVAASTSASPSGKRKRRTLLWAFFWVPVVTLLLASGVAAIVILRKPPTYVSTAKILEPGRPRLPGDLDLPDDRPVSYTFLHDLFQSPALRELTLGHLKSTKPEVVIPLGPDGVPLPVGIRVVSSARSAVHTLHASGADPDYVRGFLDALVSAGLNEVNNMREVISGDLLSSLTEQVQRLERDMMAEENGRLDFERTNKPVVLQAQSAAAVDCLKHLTTRLAELELEKRFLRCSRPQEDTGQELLLDQRIAAVRNSIQEWENKLQENSELIRVAERFRQRVDQARVPYERLATMLQDVAIRRNLSRGTFKVLEPATAAERSYAAERRLFTVAGAGGLGLGWGIVLVVAVYRRVRRRADRGSEAPSLATG